MQNGLLGLPTRKIAGDYPPNMPHFSDEAISRLPGAAVWQKAMDQWWFDFRSVLLRQFIDVEALFASDTVTQESIDAALATINAKDAAQDLDLTDIRRRLTILENQVYNLQQADIFIQGEIDSILTTITALQNLITAIDVRLTALESYVYGLDLDHSYVHVQSSPSALWDMFPVNLLGAAWTTEALVEFFDGVEQFYGRLVRIDNGHYEGHFTGSVAGTAVFKK